jgi:hypothetical protein
MLIQCTIIYIILLNVTFKVVLDIRLLTGWWSYFSSSLINTHIYTHKTPILSKSNDSNINPRRTIFRATSVVLHNNTPIPRSVPLFNFHLTSRLNQHPGNSGSIKVVCMTIMMFEPDRKTIDCTFSRFSTMNCPTLDIYRWSYLAHNKNTSI